MPLEGRGPALVLCLDIYCCSSPRLLLPWNLGLHFWVLLLVLFASACACASVRASVSVSVCAQAQTSTCRRLLEDQKLALQPTLIEQLLAENARFPPDVADSADTRGGASAEDGDEDEDSEDNDAPPLPKPAAGSGDEDDNATGSNNSSAAAATSSTSHVVSKSVSSASSSSGANRTPAATPDSAEVTVLANALTAFYKAVGADKSRADAERSARMFAGTSLRVDVHEHVRVLRVPLASYSYSWSIPRTGDLKKRQLAFETLQQRYESSDPSGAAIKELQNHFFPGRQNAVGASTEPAKTPASSSAAAGAKKISASPAPAPVAVVASAGPVPFTIISKFAWSQSEKFVSVHFDRPGCSSLPKDQASVQFTETTAELRVYDKPVDQASVLERHRWRVPNLCHPIDPVRVVVVRVAL